ncbi:hypothetical protein HOD75_00950 [archaeon]|jgi:hypothetical protein|nr:hypothetical protein [archaeon]MBT4241445.1 hypothetical protein [archaeon]MBT4417684.1 hypothetical protein [archaeon]
MTAELTELLEENRIVIGPFEEFPKVCCKYDEGDGRHYLTRVLERNDRGEITREERVYPKPIKGLRIEKRGGKGEFNESGEGIEYFVHCEI